MSAHRPVVRLSAVVKRQTRAFTRQAAFRYLGPRNPLDPNDALIICADPRGGSTWLYELLTRLEGAAGLWEPLHIGRAAVFRDLGFNYRHYIPEQSIEPKARSAFEALFQGHCREPHIMQRTSVQELRNADKLVVKFCRATQLLPWMTRVFSFTRKPVHLVRHPCAVVASQMKYGAWDHVKPGFDETEVLSDPLTRPYADILLKINTVEAHLAAVWAMTNSVALNHPDRQARWMTISYEHLVTDPRAVLSGMLQEWRLTLGNLDEIAKRPSKTTLASSPIAGGDQRNQLTHWQKALDARQIDLILGITHEIGISLYDQTAKLPTFGGFS